jgi:hypothetical protein
MAELLYDVSKSVMQGVPKVTVGIYALTLTGPDNPGFLFLWSCETIRLQLSYSKYYLLKQRIQEGIASVTLIFLFESFRKWNTA